MAGKGRIHKLKDGTKIEIRPIEETDADKMFRFFDGLPEGDRLYLKFDVTDPALVKLRLETDVNENLYRIVAIHEDRIIGDGVLEWPSHGWLSHVGEIRAITSRDFRRNGLATILFRELFIYAVKEGLSKLETRMMPDQIAIIKCVEKLGFEKEGILPEFAMDLHRKLHDLVIMSVNLK